MSKDSLTKMRSEDVVTTVTTPPSVLTLQDRSEFHVCSDDFSDAVHIHLPVAVNARVVDVVPVRRRDRDWSPTTGAVEPRSEGRPVARTPLDCNVRTGLLLS